MTPQQIQEGRYEAARLERVRRKSRHDPDYRALEEENAKLKQELADLKANTKHAKSR